MHTVELLICEGAAPGLPSFPGGNTPADLAYAAGHRKIGDYLKDKVEVTVEAQELYHDEYFEF